MIYRSQSLQLWYLSVLSAGSCGRSGRRYLMFCRRLPPMEKEWTRAVMERVLSARCDFDLRCFRKGRLMKCMPSDLRVVLLPIALLLCGCPNDSSQSQSAVSGNTRQSGAASSDATNKKTVEDDPANLQGGQSRTESLGDCLARRVDELASQLTSTDLRANQEGHAANDWTGAGCGASVVGTVGAGSHRRFI